MDIIDFRDYCLSLPLAQETTPFDEYTLVYKIGGKMFAYASIAEFRLINLKADSDSIPAMMDSHPEIGHPVHMSKGHWVSVDVSGDLPDNFVRDMIRTSFGLVISGMTKKQRAEITDAIAFLEQ